MLKEIKTNPDAKPHLYPLNRIIGQAYQQGLLKDLPLEVLIGLTMGPLTFMLKHSGQGFFELNKQIIAEISDSCWSAITRCQVPSQSIENNG